MDCVVVVVLLIVLMVLRVGRVLVVSDYNGVNDGPANKWFIHLQSTRPDDATRD